MVFQDKTVLITGGTGSLGKNLVHHIMTGKMGKPKRVIIFSRDEDKQYNMELEWKHLTTATDDVLYYKDNLLDFYIGDVRDYESVVKVVKQADIVIHAAALKQVPTGEFFPYESVKTNVLGIQNIIRAVAENDLPVETVLSISTDKACKPVNTYGMCKAIQERLTIQANHVCPGTRFICVRYGNVAASRGSIIPLFREQIQKGGPITITTETMTRFILKLETAVETIMEAVRSAKPGDIMVPILPSVKVVDLARAMIGDRDIKTEVIGIRPGEKIHEILVSEEEIPRTVKRSGFYIILPSLPQLRREKVETPVLTAELSSAGCCMSPDEIHRFLVDGGYIDA